ncbi:chromate transporter [Uliginosibacterium gangwonense]|uniref:chromate transporter n=1 Tax=Uliginosibacterium gangwonense TaxID=392736 RepID=UPI000374C63C|nr:chromate transporter [Uliginosibacterium gangwonense]
MDTNESSSPSLIVPSLLGLFTGFFRIGISSFGGALPHARRILVEQLQWVSEQEFLELLGLGQCLPGPNVGNLSIVLGARFHGWRGALAAILGLLFAPLIIALSLATLYGHMAHSAHLQHALSAMAAGAAGLMLAMGLKLASRLRKSPRWAPAVALVTLLAIWWLRLPLLWILLVLGPVSVALAWYSIYKEKAR